MEIEDFKQYTKKCFQGTSAPCMSACPLNVDVRAVIDKAQKGNFTTAYRLYRNQVIFPRIVSAICHKPCENVCIRKNVDDAINLKFIEQACINFTGDIEPIAYKVPKKNCKIAIIGAGLSGMACALKLASKNYEVTVYEKEEIPGGSLKKLLPKDVYLSEFQNEFKKVSYNMVVLRKITNLEEIQADAIYVSTGTGGMTFGLEHDMDRNSLGTKKPGIFLGGSVIGANPIEAIEQGARASHSIEKYLKVGLMDGVPETFEEKSIINNYYRLPLSAGECSENLQDKVNSDQAVAEAQRCIKCDCTVCVDSCDLMQKFKRNPKRIVIDVVSTLRPIEQFSKRVASRLINTCNQCGLCKTVCMENVDMEDCLLQARHFLFKQGAMPAAYHDFWMRDMEFANSEKAYALIPSPTEIKSNYMFFPGCQLGASEPNYVLKAFEFIKEIDKNASILVGCCGVPADWAGDEVLRDKVQKNIILEWGKIGEPIVILACPTCMKTFSRYLPEIKTISLYQLMVQYLNVKRTKKDKRMNVTVFDPCSSRHDKIMQESVRRLLNVAGYQIEELAYHRDKAKCCSYGGHIQAANLEHVKNITANRINENPNPYVTYCSNCRDTFASEGKECSHILDIIFDIGSPKRIAPDLSQRRRNRITLVNELNGNRLAAEENADKNTGVQLEISEELRKKMNAYLILEEDVAAVIEECEAAENLVHNKSTGEFTGHLSQDVITYWVTYERKTNSRKLKKVYSHRMKIEEST